MTTDRREGVNGSTAIKVPCRACSTSNITLSGEQTIDGVAVVSGDRVLVTGQTSGVNNGIYNCSTGTWSRAKDWDGPYDITTGTVVYVTSGTTNTGFYYVSTTGTITVGSTSVTIALASSVLAVISAFMQTVLDDANAAAVIETLRGSLSSETAPAVDDEILLRDTSATTGKRMTLANFFKAIDTLTAETAPDVADELALYDASASTTDKITLANLLKVINTLTEDTSPDKSADYLVSYDASASAAKKVLFSTMLRYEQVRQSVIAGSVDSSGQANFLSAGTGLAITMAATTTPVVVSAAAGEDDVGPVNYRGRYTSDQSNYWSSLPASSNVYLICDRNTSTGSWTAYSTIVPPQYDTVFDKTKNALLPFSGADASTTITDTYGNTWTASGNAQVDTGVTIDSQNTLLLDGTGDYVQSTGITSLGGDSWTVECKVRFNALPTAGNAKAIITLENAGSYGAVLFLNNTAGTYKLGVYLSSNGTSWDIASATLGTSTTYATGTTYHITIGYDAVAGKYYVYREGVVDITVSSSSRLCPITKFTLGASPGSPGTFGDLSGAFAGVRFSTCCRYPNGTTFTVPTLPFTADAEWFDIAEYKWKYGSPTSWTTKHRVAVGEAVTSAAGITSATTYALRGTYDSGYTETLPTAGTSTAKSHNLGTVPIFIRLVAKCLMADADYTVGEVIALGTNDAVYAGPMTVSCPATKTSVRFRAGNSGSGWDAQAASGAYATLTAARWAYRVTVDRGW